MSVTEDNSVPVTIIGGYLGAGKTTLVNHLLRNANGKRLAILVNEFGDLPIDADLIEAKEDDLISLAGGCVCCSYGSGLMEAFEKLAAMVPVPDHVVLEASGVAIPGAIAGSLSILSGFKTEGLVILVDAEQILEQARDRYLADTIQRQLADADLVLLNKCDLVAEPRLEEVSDWLSTNAQNAIITPCRHGEVPCEIVLSGFAGPDPVASGNSSHSASFETAIYIPQAPIAAEQLKIELVSAHPGLTRAKGFFTDPDGQLVTLQMVGRRMDVSSAPQNAKPGIVVIWQKDCS